MRRIAQFALICLFLAGTAVRADDWPGPRGPSREPKPHQYDPKSLTEVPHEFLDDAPACILYSRTTHLIEPDGTTEAITHEITRFNGRKGIEKLGEYRSIYFTPRYEKLTLNEARVIKPDGTFVPVEARHVQLRDVVTDFQVYDESKQLVISWPNLQVGDAYEVKWTVRGRNPEFAGEFFTRYTFGDDEHPVVRDELYVVLPRGKRLWHDTINGAVDLTKTEMRRETHYHWKSVNKPPLPRDDERPSREEMRLQVACSTFDSWEAVGKWKQKVRAECWECTPAVKQVIANVAIETMTPHDKARALTYWVRQNIRYLSRGPEGLGYTPQHPAAVLANRFGDCKDQAQLLAVMLKEIGLPVWLVTLGTLDDGQVLESVPSPWGTHAILYVEIDGKGYWIDSTVSQAAWDFLPRGDCNRQVYLTRDGTIKLARTPPFTYKDFRVEQTTRITIAPDGTSRSKRTASYQASSAWYKRDAWLDTPAGERRRLVASELQDAHSRARLVALKVDEKSLRDFDGPVRAEVEFEIADHFAGEPREGVLTDSTVWSRFLSYTLDPSRDLPYVFSMPFESVHCYIVELPPALSLSHFPEEKKIESPWGFFETKVTSDPADMHRVEIRMHTRLEKTRVEKEDFEAFQKFHEGVSKAYRAWLSLRPAKDLADAPALEALLADSTNGDTFSAKVLARLYRDHNKFADARRVLADAIKHNPEDRSLWEMRLDTAADLAEKGTIYRAMVERFPDDGPFAAALGANLVAQGDYAEARRVLQPLTEHGTPAVKGAAQYQLARADFEQRRLKEALKHLEAAVDADVALLTDVKAVDFKARVHEKLGQATIAIETYKLGLEIDDKEHDLFDPLIRLEWREGRKSDALDHLRRFTVAAGNDAGKLVKVADLHLLLGRHDDALDLASRIPVESLTPEAHRVLGLAQVQRKEYAKAIGSLDKAGASDECVAGLLHAHLALGHLDQAGRLADVRRPVGDRLDELGTTRLKVMRLLLLRQTLIDEISPGDVAASTARAISLFVCAEHALAERWPAEQVDKLLQASLQEVEIGPALALRGWLAIEKGQLAKALADAEKAIALKSADARAFLVRGRVRLERGDSKALDDLEHAATLSRRQDATVLHWLAAAQAEAGRLSQAIRTQQQALDLRPGDPELADQLRSLEKKQSGS